MKLPIVNKILLALLALLALNCGSKEKKQEYINNYTTVVKEFMARKDIIKKGQAAIIAYRRSNFMDVDNAEIAKNHFLESIKLDSAALIHLSDLKSKEPTEKEITDLLYAGIESISQGTAIFASNYSKAKDQNFEQRRETLMDVESALIYLARGFNSVVISITNAKNYIKENDLEEDAILSTGFRYFETERDNLKSFLRE